MNWNPFKYNTPLDPVTDNPVCLPRQNAINEVIEGIMRGDYWAILGPSQTGKTTFFNLVKENFPYAYYLYLDFRISHSSETNFYHWLMKIFEHEIPSTPSKKNSHKFGNNSPLLVFMQFLENFNPEINDRKIVLLVDNVEESPYVKGFLKLWRKVFQLKDQSEVFSRYSIIATGSRDLISLSHGPTSPFNIANKLFLKDFSRGEAEHLIDEVFDDLKIKLEHNAKDQLLSDLNGHPQLLQHACAILVDKAAEQKKFLTPKDVDETITVLLKENSNLERLREELRQNIDLRELVKEVLKGEKIKFLPYQELSISGAGAITDDNDCCVVRNELYKKVITGFLSQNDQETLGIKKSGKEANYGDK